MGSSVLRIHPSSLLQALAAEGLSEAGEELNTNSPPGEHIAERIAWESATGRTDPVMSASMPRNRAL